MLPPVPVQSPSSSSLSVSTCIKAKPYPKTIQPTSQPVPAVEFVEISFEALSAFDRVTTQFESLGVRFQNAIALKPSNPVFPQDEEACVLLPTGNNTSLTLEFLQPMEWVEVHVSSVQSVRMRGMDASDTSISEAGDAYDYCNLGAHPCHELPHQCLRVAAAGLSKVVIESNTPLTLNNIAFGR